MFKTSTDFCLHLEKIKIDHEFDTYIEAVTYFAETESDQSYEHIVKCLNKKICDQIAVEAAELNMLKSKDEINTL